MSDDEYVTIRLPKALAEKAYWGDMEVDQVQNLCQLQLLEQGCWMSWPRRDDELAYLRTLDNGIDPDD